MIKKNESRLLLGAHISVAGGLEKSIERGESIGCTTIQIFTKSNRQWSAKPLTDEQIDLFKNSVKNSSIDPIITHACYLINLAATNKEFYLKSIESLELDLSRCEQLEIPYLVLHPGSGGKQGADDGLDKIIKGLNTALHKVPGKTMVLLETMAGQGSSLCATFEQLHHIRSNIDDKKRIGICVDTCHIFAAGYDFRTEAAYEKLWKEFDDIIGLNHLKLFHLNDSKKDIGSRVDRHEHIGKGKIGLHAFAMLMNDARFFDIPKIVETPKGEDPLKDDKHNIDTLKHVLTSKTKKLLKAE